MRIYGLFCSVLLLVSGVAFGQVFQAKKLAEKMDAFGIVIPRTHTYIRDCAPSFLAGGVQACTVHNAGPYFIQLAVPNQTLAQLKIQLVVGHGYGPHSFRRYGGPALLAFLMAVTDSQKGGLYLFQTLSKHIAATTAQWKGVRVSQSVKPHAYLWKAVNIQD
ncbi:hypothetical protein [Acidithiobacillus ferriphilus]|jgi:hypothetical protein|uniref:hypothetical protein n=1 Tax=Acidithiobacillus ferriphilus TaxID=1689834 RepID=UPI001C075D95|nr:hypothetical protein [Acidithiobacillus ferriphilus]MBU2829101.1 hypothetical protein [Acidithiobacillus ferriphilus]